MHIDRPPTILMMTYQAIGVLKYDAADPFDGREAISAMRFLRWGVATTHRGNIPKNDKAENFYEPQALSGIRGLLAVVPDPGDGMVQHPPMGMRAAMTMIRSGGAIQGLARWAARGVRLHFAACLTKTPIKSGRERGGGEVRPQSGRSEREAACVRYM